MKKKIILKLWKYKALFSSSQLLSTAFIYYWSEKCHSFLFCSLLMVFSP